MAGRVRRLLRLLTSDPATMVRRVGTKVRLAQLRQINRWSRRSCVGVAPAVVNLTSYGQRMSTVFYTLESIAQGSTKPRRLILWIDDPDVLAAPPPQLLRLAQRGVELIACEDLGPHKKQQPYVATVGSFDLPLVTADDDRLYDKDWLQGLLDAHARFPADLLGYRAHQVVLDRDRPAPYSTWRPQEGTAASFATFCTGVSGMLYPVAALDALRHEGDGFRTRAPQADDVWVHAVTVRAGIRSRQVGPYQREFREVPGTQVGTLYRRNVLEGGNDVQIAASYSPEVISRIAEDLLDDR